MKGKKFAILLILVFFAIYVAIVLGVNPNSHPLEYNAVISDLELQGVYELQFARENDGDNVTVYKVLTNGQEPVRVGLQGAAKWQLRTNKNSIFSDMGGYTGKTEIDGKKASITRNLFYTQIGITEKDHYTILEKRLGFAPNFQIYELKWLSDARHLIMVSSEGIGFYDTKTKKYAKIAEDGWWILSR